MAFPKPPPELATMPGAHQDDEPLETFCVMGVRSPDSGVDIDALGLGGAVLSGAMAKSPPPTPQTEPLALQQQQQQQQPPPPPPSPPPPLQQQLNTGPPVKAPPGAQSKQPPSHLNEPPAAGLVLTPVTKNPPFPFAQGMAGVVFQYNSPAPPPPKRCGPTPPRPASPPEPADANALDTPMAPDVTSAETPEVLAFMAWQRTADSALQALWHNFCVNRVHGGARDPKRIETRLLTEFLARHTPEATMPASATALPPSEVDPGRNELEALREENSRLRAAFISVDNERRGALNNLNGLRSRYAVVTRALPFIRDPGATQDARRLTDASVGRLWRSGYWCSGCDCPVFEDCRSCKFCYERTNTRAEPWPSWRLPVALGGTCTHPYPARPLNPPRRYRSGHGGATGSSDLNAESLLLLGAAPEGSQPHNTPSEAWWTGTLDP